MTFGRGARRALWCIKWTFIGIFAYGLAGVSVFLVVGAFSLATWIFLPDWHTSKTMGDLIELGVACSTAWLGTFFAKKGNAELVEIWNKRHIGKGNKEEQGRAMAAAQH